MHKRLVAHILLLAVMFMVAAFSGNVTAASGTYNDPLGRFSVGIPTGWILNRTYPDGFTVLFAKGTERFEIQTAEMTQTDPIAKAKMFFGANSPTVFNTGADGLLYTAYSESGRSFYCVFVFQDNIGFMLRHSAPVGFTAGETVARQWLAGFNAAANASNVPQPEHWLTVEPVLHKDPRGKFTISLPGFWVPTAINETIGDAVYTTTFAELGGNGDICIKVYPGYMGDLVKHMNGWLDSLATDPQYPGFAVSDQVQTAMLGSVPASFGFADFGIGSKRTSVILMLTTNKGTNYSVFLKYNGQNAGLYQMRLLGLLKSMRL
ncbi:MAG: hypothetical protein ACOX8I_07550 [Bacillota bacterium]|jgi:hypothetical protein